LKAFPHSEHYLQPLKAGKVCAGSAGEDHKQQGVKSPDYGSELNQQIQLDHWDQGESEKKL
jgi:hypothetical protein